MLISWAAGIDVDGVLRGKFMSKAKFLSAAKTEFGFCSVILYVLSPHISSSLIQAWPL